MWRYRKRSFKFIRQHDSMECGLCCIAMICCFLGREYSLEFIRNNCRCSKEGISLKAIADFANKVGLETHSLKLSQDELQSISLPCLLHWNQNHFVLLYGIDRKHDKYCIADPGKGKYKLTSEEFKRQWISVKDNNVEEGICMFFEPTPDFINHNQNNEMKDERRSFRFLLSYIGRYKKYFIKILIGLFLGCVLQLILPFLTQSIVDTGIKNEDIGFIWLVLLGELMIVVGRTSIDFIRRWLLLHISMRINLSLVSDFFIKLLKLPMAFFDTKMTGDILQRIGDHSRVQSFLTNQVLNIVFNFLSFIVLGIVLLIYDKLIFFMFIAGSIVYGVWITMFLRRRKILDYELFEQQAINQNLTYQFISTMQEVKLQGCEKRRRWEWEDVQADLFNVQIKILRLQQTQEAGSIFINEVKNIIITVLAATAVINGYLTLGAMLAVQYIIGQLNSPVDQLITFIYSLQDVKISLERINDIHEGKNEENEFDALMSYANKNKNIRIDGIDFKYDIHSTIKTIDGVFLDIPEGKVTAIVGASGSGKTTLLKLMLGYYPVLKGKIKIAGEDIKNYNLKWWRSKCGVVMQDGVIFSESIARNIAVEDGEIDYQRLIKSAKIAVIHEFIESLPLGYDTKIGHDGIGISQGQKQRILIARAVYKNPDFIFLDEATNALDTSNERIIVRNLNEFYKGRSVIIVAHRLSTVKNADHIIVMEHGRVVETGSHTFLIKKKGVYYQLLKNQLELGN